MELNYKFSPFLLGWILISFLALTGCEDNPPPVEANDYGQLRVTVSPKGINVKNKPGKWYQQSDFETLDLVLDGAPIQASFSGLWTPFYGGLGGFSKICALEDTTYSAGGSIPLDAKQIKDEISTNLTTIRPCWLKDGVGIYLKLDRSLYKGTIDPNEQECNFHMGHFHRSLDSVISFGGITDAHHSEDVSQFFPLESTFFHEGSSECKLIRNRRIAVKVLDTWYDDNGAGRYAANSKTNKVLQIAGEPIVQSSTYKPEILFWSGVYDPGNRLIQAIVSFFVDPLKDILEAIYKAIVQSTEYQVLYYVTMMLMVIMTGISVTLGIFPVEKLGNWVMFVFKIGFVVSVAHPNGWEFFNTFFVQTLFDGLLQLAEYVSSKVSNFPINSEAPFSMFDNIVRMLFSKQLNTKISALLFYERITFIGIIYIPLIYIAILLVCYSMLKMAIIYVFAYTSTIIALSMAPFMVLFLLFNKTKEYFDGWLKLIIGNGIQIMIIFALMSYFYFIFLSQIIEIFHYRVVWKSWLKWSISMPGNDSDDAEDATLTLIDWKYWQASDDFEFPFETLVLLIFTATALSFFSDKIPSLAASIAGGANFTNMAKGAISMMDSIRNSVTGVGDTGEIDEMVKSSHLSTKSIPIVGGRLAKKYGDKKLTGLPSLTSPIKSAGDAIKGGIDTYTAQSQARTELKKKARGFSSQEIGKLNEGKALDVLTKQKLNKLGYKIGDNKRDESFDKYAGNKAVSALLSDNKVKTHQFKKELENHLVAGKSYDEAKDTILEDKKNQYLSATPDKALGKLEEDKKLLDAIHSGTVIKKAQDEYNKGLRKLQSSKLKETDLNQTLGSHGKELRQDIAKLGQNIQTLKEKNPKLSAEEQKRNQEKLAISRNHKQALENQLENIENSSAMGGNIGEDSLMGANIGEDSLMGANIGSASAEDQSSTQSTKQDTYDIQNQIMTLKRKQDNIQEQLDKAKNDLSCANDPKDRDKFQQEIKLHEMDKQDVKYKMDDLKRKLV